MSQESTFALNLTYHSKEQEHERKNTFIISDLLCWFQL
jgi:hypothetical protein